jgi:hypothetical protein
MGGIDLSGKTATRQDLFELGIGSPATGKLTPASLL